MRKSIIISLVTAIIFCSIPAFADTIHVPTDQPTIQAGIDATVAGDLVLVAPGTYVENIDFLGKAITVWSEQGADATIIDGNQNGSVVSFISGETRNTVINGFTVRNGYGGFGGVCCMYGSSPTILNCKMMENIAIGGGGVFCWASSPAVTNCTITGNEAGMFGGGGICCVEGSSPVITNCLITDNHANDSTFGYGGGICCWLSEGFAPRLRIDNCTITGNTADDSGGGIYCQSTILIVRNCTISGNSVSTYEADGGGICCDGSMFWIENSMISDNSASGGYAAGGGIKLSYSLGMTTNCLITGNSASGYNKSIGGGIHSHYSFAVIRNSTISGNEAGESGGGIYLDALGFWMTNSILWGNCALNGQEIYMGIALPVVTYSDVNGGFLGKGNIDEDPLFAGEGDFHLSPDSPCIDAGRPKPIFNDTCFPPSMGTARND
ncbi:nitrous oxide reductase family maturation protein NosD, partial [Thermodesulfobacteriota bacterium]